MDRSVVNWRKRRYLCGLVWADMGVKVSQGHCMNNEHQWSDFSTMERFLGYLSRSRCSLSVDPAALRPALIRPVGCATLVPPSSATAVPRPPGSARTWLTQKDLSSRVGIGCGSSQKIKTASLTPVPAML